MTRQCEKCGFVNQDDYDFCAKCGNPLIEGVQPRNFMVIAKNTKMATFAFFGFFMPFYLVQSRHPTIRKHGIIQLLISLVGVALSFYVMLH